MEDAILIAVCLDASLPLSLRLTLIVTLYLSLKEKRATMAFALKQDKVSYA